MALTAQELMIDNWLQFRYTEPAKYAQVAEIRVNGVRLMKKHGTDTKIYTSGQIEGIVVTNELMRELGFECKRVQNVDRSTNEILFMYKINEEIYIWVGEGWFKMASLVSVSNIKFKYLHDLQNVYFISTRKPLNLDLWGLKNQQVKNPQTENR